MAAAGTLAVSGTSMVVPVVVAIAIRAVVVVVGRAGIDAQEIRAASRAALFPA